MAGPASHLNRLAMMLDDLRTLQVISTRRMIECKAFDRTGRQVAPRGNLFDVLQQLDAELRAPGDERPLVAEVRVGESGEVEFRHTFDLESVSPAQLVIDTTYRHPHHPRPGMAAPAGVAVTDRPTDPAVLDTVRTLVGEFTRLYTTIKGRAPDFGAGHSEDEILAAERAIGLRLPEEVRALYRLVHDDRPEQGLLGAQSLLPLAEVVSGYLAGDPGSFGWDDGLFVVNPVVFEANPRGRIRRVSRSDAWVTIACDWSGNWCAVDLDPAPLGRAGQLLEYGRDVVGPVGYVAVSVTAVMREVVEALRAGEYEDTEPQYPRLPTTRRIGAAEPAPYSQVQMVGDRPVAAILAEFDGPFDVQELHLNGPTVGIDLADLAPLANLRDISVNQAATVDPALPHHVPAEALAIHATSINLPTIAGHPTLWRLILKGAAAPISIEPLTTLPALAHLDLSAVEVTDLEWVTDIPRLKVLELNPGQWQYLRDRDAVPTTLAAAVLGEVTPLAEAVDWATWLRGHSAGG